LSETKNLNASGCIAFLSCF